MSLKREIVIEPFVVGDSEREFALLLISLYKEHPVLWDTQHKQYSVQQQRNEALSEICETLKEYKPEYTVEILRKKLNILRTNYNKEKNKFEKRKLESPDDAQEPNLWYYKEMSFLSGQDMHAKRIAASKAAKKPTLIKIIKRRNHFVTADPLHVNRLEDEDLTLAKCWVMKLRKLAPDQRLYAEKIINDTLFEAEMGSLTRSGVSFHWKDRSSDLELESS